MLKCKKCGAKVFVINTRRKSSGDVRRRFQCNSCSNSWVEWNGKAPPSSAPEIRLSDDAILDILTDKSPQPVLAERHGCSMSAVGRIRRGELHPNIHPEVPRFNVKARPPRKSCRKCIYYTGIDKNPCDLGHEDPVQEGLTFALHCPNFIMNSPQQ